MFRGQKLLMYRSSPGGKPPSPPENEEGLDDTLQHLKKKEKHPWGMVHPLSLDWIMFPPCRNSWGKEEITGWGASRGVQSPRPAQLPVLFPFSPPLGCMQATAAWVLPPGKSLPFTGIYPTPSARGAPGGGRDVGAVGKETIFSIKRCFLQGYAKDFYLYCFALPCCPKSVASWKDDTGFWETACPKLVRPWSHLTQLPGWLQQQALQKRVRRDKRSSPIYCQWAFGNFWRQRLLWGFHI